MSEIIIYQDENGVTNLEVMLENETVWLSQKQLSELFDVTTATINEHIKNIYLENELKRDSTIRKFLIVQKEGTRNVKRQIEHYNLDMIISVGYRVKSNIATKFRQWATKTLKEYIIKGFVLDDERLKQAKNSYFDELLERIRDIRSSEKLFWQKVLDIYATSVDYDPRDEISKEFFKTIQNKMHFATHGQTAAEIIFQRADSSKPFMGMTNFSGYKPTKKEAIIAKNYLNENELEILNGIVSSYLEFAELQAKRRKVMKMRDWIKKLDDFLNLSSFDVLQTKGKISHSQAIKKASDEYEKYKAKTINEKSKAEIDFDKFVKKLEDKK
ncbi:Virulence protein [Campylobacter sputorum subsp. bubulus]|uniref:Virulence protein n=1 Tax=Campylobacter sputorum subsp. sputorum TaxID=32024 RepID=A0A381DJE4_9BACT|nr:virulence RhuM family protein [Campylobacter sputorum]ASM35833.1 putative virulence protein, RhuM family [Campylobacter sputorum aubsp. sputorum RM3237]KAB0581546.1 virulence RhuM family protein [Campylobacter sputorum subsp. sputorum]QEL06023.1 RhuM family protein [Campylobacter sputorum subsp. sputorum]SUX09133.1 Virulence protein [Campylobacter sputorum subsp. bubulus]SUX10824.1 Virulence protein [Campylobacter sputorum subsp. sputorum]